MRALISGLLAALTLAATPACAQTPKPAPGKQVALVGATILDGDGGAPIRDGVILLSGDRIEAVGPRNKVRIPRTAERVDVTGKWITPGLIDAHVHFFQSGGLYTRPDGIDLTAQRPYAQDLAWSKGHLDETFARYLAAGVTTVVDAGGPNWNFDVRDRSVAVQAPRVEVAGPLIATEPTPQTQKLVVAGDAPIISAATPEEAAQLARNLLPRKPAFIKIWGIGEGAAGAARVKAVTAAVAAVAHPAGVRVAVHATELELAKAALEGGADILVHSVEDKPVDQAFLDLLKQRNAVYVTTLMVYEGYRDGLSGKLNLSPIELRLAAPDMVQTFAEVPPPYRAAAASMPNALPRAQANLKLVAASGARVAAGTDAGNPGTMHGPALHRELELMVQAGLTPMQALTYATRDAAFAYAAKPDIGRLAKGYRADLLVLDADPAAGVANLQRVSSMWLKGQRIDPNKLVPASPESVVQLQLERYNAHDIEGFLATYADDAKLFDLPDTQKPTSDGKAAMRQVYGPLFARAPGLKCDIAHRSVEGAFVIDHEICRTGVDPPLVRAVATYEVRDGLIRRVWFAAAE